MNGARASVAQSHNVVAISIRGAQSHSFVSYYRYFRSKSDVYGYEIYCYSYSYKCVKYETVDVIHSDSDAWSDVSCLR
jgi:hypothetical protein